MDIFDQLRIQYNAILKNEGNNIHNSVRIDNIQRMIYKLQEEIEKVNHHINNNVQCSTNEIEDYQANKKADYIINNLCMPLVAYYLVSENATL